MSDERAPEHDATPGPSRPEPDPARGADAALLFANRAGDFRGVAIDPGGVALLGCEAAAFSGFRLDEVLPPDAALEIVGHLQRVCDTVAASAADIDLQLAGGLVRVSASFSPVLGGDGACDGVFVALRRVQASDDTRAPESLDARLSATRVGVFRSESNIGNVFVNGPLLDILGLSHEQALGHGWLDVVHPDDRARLQEALRSSERSGAAGDLELRIVRPDGQHRRVRIRAVPLRGDDGTVTGYIGSTEDITEQVAAEQMSARLTELAELAHDLVGIADARGRVLYFNPAARRALGLDPDGDLRDLRVGDFFSRGGPTDVGAITRALADEGSWSGDAVIRAVDGRELEVDLTAIAHRGPDGGIDYFSCIGRDKTAETARRREIERLATTLATTSDLVSFHDSAGRAFFMNRAAREFFGVPLDGPVPPLRAADLVDATTEELAALIAGAERDGAWRGELSLKAGERRLPVSLVLVAQRGADGELEYFAAQARDVTDRLAAEDARRRSETALRAIVQHSPLAILAVDERGTVRLWNRASERIFGWSADEAIGRRSPLAEGDTSGACDQLLGRVFAGETLTDVELPGARRDGSPVDLSISMAPLEDATGRVVTAVCVVADVTDRKQAEAALRASEVRFRSLVQRAFDMILILDGEWRVRYASPSAAEFVGTDADTLAGGALPAISHPDDNQSVVAMYEAVAATPDASHTTRFRVRRADGSERWLETTATNLLDDPHVAGIVVNARDVTEHVAADEALRTSEQLLSAVVTNVGDVIAILDGEGTIRYVSPAVGHLLGFQPHEGLGINVFDIMHRDDVPNVRRAWEEGTPQPGVYGRSVETRLRHADGHWVPMEVVANNLLDDPAVNGVVVTARDISERRAAEEALRVSEDRVRASETRYRAVVDDQTELVCRYRADTTLTFVNRAFAEFYGRSPQEMVGSRLIDLFPVAEQADELVRLASFGPARTVQTYEDWEIAADGSSHYFQWTDRAFLDEEGRVVEFQSVGRDVSEHRRATLLTEQQAEILELVARGDALPDSLAAIARAVSAHFPGLVASVLLLDAETRTLRSGAAPDLPVDLRRMLDDIPVGSDGGTCAAAALRGEPVTSTDVAGDPVWGGWRDVLLSHGLRACVSTPITASDGVRVLGTLAVYARQAGDLPGDLPPLVSLLAHLAAIAVERRDFEEQLSHQAVHDPLSGLPNRTLFLDRLGIGLARCRRTRSRAAVLFIDLDRFKVLNDTLGHEAGDELLVAAARRLESVIRPGDTVARFGGDEFTVLCEDLTAGAARERAAEIAKRLLSVIAAPFGIAGQEAFLGASIGIALAISGEEQPEDLLRDAEAAMYQAKEAGRGRFEVFDSALRQRLVARHATETALHRALERAEFTLFYQPIVSLADERVVGAEALVRWQHPERGLVLPGEFIGLAEETGLIVDLGAWVLEEAARQAALRQVEQRTPFVVSVNLSARQVAQPDLADRVAEVIEATGADPANVALEITESTLMDDLRGVLGVIEQIKALGIQLSIDDFGTGYASLDYLKRFPVDAVKIDRSFVDGLGTDPGDSAIVSAVIGLAHALGLRVVAEGVETAGQLAELQALGCDQAQGYYFAPPQPLADLRGLLGGGGRWRGGSRSRSPFTRP